MDHDTVSAAEFGRGLRGLGVNLLSPGVPRLAEFLEAEFGISVLRAPGGIAVAPHDGANFQLHSDGADGPNPVFGLLPENPPRNRAHGLREATIFSPEDFAFSPAMAREL